MLLLTAITSLCVTAQTKLTVTQTNTGSVRAGDALPLTITLSGSAGQNVAGTQWSLNSPIGFVWTPTVGAAGVAGSKNIYCGLVASAFTCLVVGMNVNVVNDGVVGLLATTVPINQPIGNLTFTLTSTLSASKDGFAVVTTASAPLTIPILPSLCDPNGDAKIDSTDFNLAIAQATGASTCTTDTDGDGKCTVNDVLRVAMAANGGACKIN